MPEQVIHVPLKNQTCPYYNQDFGLSIYIYIPINHKDCDIATLANYSKLEYKLTMLITVILTGLSILVLPMSLPLVQRLIDAVSSFMIFM